MVKRSDERPVFPGFEEILLCVIENTENSDKSRQPEEILNAVYSALWGENYSGYLPPSSTQREIDEKYYFEIGRHNNITNSYKAKIDEIVRHIAGEGSGEQYEIELERLKETIRRRYEKNKTRYRNEINILNQLGSDDTFENQVLGFDYEQKRSKKIKKIKSYLKSEGWPFSE